MAMIQVQSDERVALPLLPSSMLQTAHGFFTRQGGVSRGVYASLNAGPGSQDEQDAIAENRRRLAEWFGQPADHLLTLNQCHSARCITVDSPYAAEDTPQADALVTNVPGLILGVLTADCVPVLLHDPVAGVIGAAHAGWKGALSGIIEETLTAMNALGAKPGSTRAAAGPSIAQDSYEVDGEFREQFLEQSTENRAYFLPSPDKPQSHFLFNNKAYVADRLRQCGVLQLEIMAHDTYALGEQFFSFRRATHQGQSDYGRQLSAIMLG